MRLPRRRFLTLSGSAIASGFLLAACKGARRAEPDAAPATDGPTTGPLTLTPALRLTLGAATARILPSDEGAGAREADVVEYIARQLEDQRIGRNRQLILRGLIELDAEADRRKHPAVPARSPAEQDDVLAACARGELKLGKLPADGFLRALVVLTLEGFLGDPSYGGNKDKVGWRSIDYPEIAHAGHASPKPGHHGP
jgi:gluconate 2-dehydrogenase gamma chain